MMMKGRRAMMMMTLMKMRTMIKMGMMT